MRRLAVALLLATAVAAATEVDPASQKMRLQIAEVERAIDRRLGEIRTDSQPIMQLGATRGAYLDGYGAVFTLELPGARGSEAGCGDGAERV